MISLRIAIIWTNLQFDFVLAWLIFVLILAFKNTWVVFLMFVCYNVMFYAQALKSRKSLRTLQG